VIRFSTITLWHIDAGIGRRPPHHSRRALIVGYQGAAVIGEA
jgi:hypothetical protein